MLYQFHELQRALLGPTSLFAHAGARLFSAPDSWFAGLPGAARLAAGYELIYRLGKEYPKPEFGIPSVVVRGTQVAVIEHAVMTKPFCRLLRFSRCSDDPGLVGWMKRNPVVLVVAPLSGHHATLLRDTVRALLSDHEVYVTDWIDAREVRLTAGAFSLDDYVAYIQSFVRYLGADRVHVVAVCQPTVPVLAAASLMATAGEPVPRSLVLMGGPIDARCNPTQVNNLATTHSLRWFETHLVHPVPARYPGRGRQVYPGFLQHAGFIAMNPGRHMSSHWDFYRHLVEGDMEDAEAHRRFYDEYNAVVDLPAEYYLDSIRIVFQEHLLPRGLWHVAGRRVAPEALSDTSLLTVEGELDDISGLGQTQAAHALCTRIPPERKQHLTVRGAGHYGIFSGRRWRDLVYPSIRDFIAGAGPGAPPEPAANGGNGPPEGSFEPR